MFIFGSTPLLLLLLLLLRPARHRHWMNTKEANGRIAQARTAASAEIWAWNRADVASTRPAKRSSSTRYPPVTSTLPGADTRSTRVPAIPSIVVSIRHPGAIKTQCYVHHLKYFELCARSVMRTPTSPGSVPPRTIQSSSQRSLHGQVTPPVSRFPQVSLIGGGAPPPASVAPRPAPRRPMTGMANGAPPAPSAGAYASSAAPPPPAEPVFQPSPEQQQLLQQARAHAASLALQSAQRRDVAASSAGSSTVAVSKLQQRAAAAAQVRSELEGGREWRYVALTRRASCLG